jgi:transcriptional regulator with XRE-family HTH domain
MIKASTKGYRFAETKTAQYISKQIDALSSVRSQREIADLVGWPQPNILSMIKRGEVKPPLEKVPALAKALSVDPALLMKFVLQDHHSELFEALVDTLGLLATKEEIELLQFVRSVTNDTVPSLTELHKAALTQVFA